MSEYSKYKYMLYGLLAGIVLLSLLISSVVYAYTPDVKEYSLDRIDGIYEYSFVDSHGRKCTGLLSTNSHGGGIAVDCD